MNSPIVRWWIIFASICIILTTVLKAGFAAFILSADITFISWIILGVLAIGSVYIGRLAKSGEINSSLNRYFMDTCTSLGLLGTVIGLIIMVVGAFTNIDVNSQESIRASLLAMSSGIGSALVTTLVGLVSAMLLKLQLVIVGGNRADV